MSICSTNPVQDPQELLALVHFLTSSSVNKPCSRIALTIVPLDTPLQPQTSSTSVIAAALLWPSWPTSPILVSPNMRVSRISAILWLSRMSLKYQVLSAVSPNMQAPIKRSSFRTSFLYTPPMGSASVISSVPSPPIKFPAENKSTPVTLSFVDVTDPS